MSKFYITTPIYYVNDKPHIGHAYTTVVGDVLARWKRQNGFDVFYLTGTDEHGSKVAAAAQAENKSPQKFCDEIAEIYKSRWQNLNISYNYFIRTTDADHIERVKQIFSQLKNGQTPKGNDVIYKDNYQGLYCSGCEKFLTEKELVNGKCPDHNKKPETLKEKNYFFKLSDYKEIIKEKITNDEFKILPISRKNEALSMLDFVDDFSVSRESVAWGIELPFDQTQKITSVLNNKNTKVVLYCRSGSMSKIAAQTLTDMGYSNVYELIGGLHDWISRGRKTVPIGSIPTP